jgi:hypothetical protein
LPSAKFIKKNVKLQTDIFTFDYQKLLEFISLLLSLFLLCGRKLGRFLEAEKKFLTAFL